MKRLNREIELSVRANSMYVSVMPKTGVLAIGENGVEFQADSQGYIQIPWKEIVHVEAQLMFFDKYVRGCFIETKSGTFNFVVSKGKLVLQTMAKHLPNSMFTKHRSTLSRRFGK